MKEVKQINPTNKFAYLIIAHQDIEQLLFLIRLLDHQRNDIYILFDEKFILTDNDKTKLMNSTKWSKIFFTKRIKIFWGGYSQIEAELILFSAAYNKGYQHYHLISGNDLPLVPQNVIHEYFDLNIEYSFLTLNSNLEVYEDEILNRIKYYHIFRKFTPRTFPGFFGKILFKLYRKIAIMIQEILRINLLDRYEIFPVKASNWVTLSHNCVEIIIDNSNLIEKIFKYSFLGDELFIPTILFYLNKQNLIKNLQINKGTSEEYQGNMRYINWWDGYPYEWTDSVNDFKQIQEAANNGYFFSRKFNLKRYPGTKVFIEKLLRGKK